MTIDASFCTEILHGTKQWTSGRAVNCKIIRVFLISSSSGFNLERRLYYGSIEPEMAKFSSTLGLSLETFDPCVAPPESNLSTFELKDPRKLSALVREITNSSSNALATFFLFFIDNESSPPVVPLTLLEDEFKGLKVASSSTSPVGPSLLDSFYKLDCNCQPVSYVFDPDAHEFTFDQLENLLNSIASFVSPLAEGSFMQHQQSQNEFSSNLNVNLLKSHVHFILKEVLKLKNRPEVNILSFVKLRQDCQSLESVTGNCSLSSLLEDVICEVHKSNIFFFTDPSDGKEPPARTSVDKYQALLYAQMTAALRSAIESTRNSLLIEYPMDVVAEADSHLYNLNAKLSPESLNGSLENSSSVDQMFKLFLQANCSTRHPPVIVVGPSGIGKSTLLAHTFDSCTSWLTENKFFNQIQVIRITRLLGKSPTSSYSSELLRSLCDQLIHSCDLEELEDAESMSLSTRFHELLKLIEFDETVQVVIILDDLHLLKTLQTSSILNWLPWSLPPNVHLICSISSSSLSMLSVLKTRIASENFIHLNPVHTPSSGSNLIHFVLQSQSKTLTQEQFEYLNEQLNLIYDQQLLRESSSPSPSSPSIAINLQNEVTTATLDHLYIKLLARQVLARWPSSLLVDSSYPFPTTVNEIVNAVLWSLEQQLGFNLVSKICTYISYTRFGFRESEILELIASEDPNVSVCAWFHMKSILIQGLLDQFMVMGRYSFHWSHWSIAEAVKMRYKGHSVTHKSIHRELGQAFFLGFTETVSVLDSASVGVIEKCDVLRELDELWFHLLESQDINKLKKDAVLSIDFLMASVSTASIYYLKCILELVTGHILDFEVELLINMLKHSTATVLLDANQLATEIILWLKPFTTTPSTLPSPITSPSTLDRTLESLTAADMQCKTIFLDKLVVDARSWSLRRSIPFLVPTNTWLKLPLPLQTRIITCPWTAVARGVISKDNQNLIACTGSKWHIFHLASRTLTQTFEGSGGKQTAICISKSGRYLVTGSDDSCVTLWEFVGGTFVEKYQLSHHTAGILCVQVSPSEQLILSGSENGVVAVADLKTGMLRCKIIHHKGMVTSICVNDGNDVFTIGSTDCSVSIWSVSNCSFLNQMFLPKAIFLMDISSDSTFLMVVCEDNRIHIRALTTGTAVHCLDHPSSNLVTCAKFAEDSCRAIVGTGDGKVLIYDVHSGKLTQTLVGHSEMITVIIPTVNDRFLLTCGGSKLIIWNFSTRKDRPCATGEGSTSTKRQSSTCNSNTLTLTTSTSPSSPSATTAGGSGEGPSGTNGQRTSYTKYSRPPSKRIKKVENHMEPVTCIAVSRDGTLAVTGSRDSTVKIWTLSSGETHTTLAGHKGPVTCVTFSANGLFVVSGSEDTNLTVWGLTVGLIVSTFAEHRVKPLTVQVSSDSKKILSVDESGIHRLWIADTGQQVFVISKPTTNVTFHGNNIFAQASRLSNNLRYWSTFDPENEKSVSHSEAINCYHLTYDGQTIVTGSQDKSLKVWEVSSGKLTQILVGHEASVSCVHIAGLKPSLIISGSMDCNSIVWDMTTGTEMFTLRGHAANVSNVRLALDGSMALTAGDDNLLILWSEKGTKIALLNLHHSFTNLATPLNTDQVVIQLNNSSLVPIIKLHNNPAKGKTIDLPPGTPIEGLGDQLFPLWRGIIPGSKKLLGRNLKREQSFDSFYFESLNRGVSVDDFRKLAHLTSCSPSMSREHLATTGIIWDGSDRTGTVGSTSVLTGPRSMATGGPLARLKLSPKQKVLKKQQSMFAFFPEQNYPSAKLVGQLAQKDFAKRRSPVGRGQLNRSQSLESDDMTASKSSKGLTSLGSKCLSTGNSDSTFNSHVCSVS